MIIKIRELDMLEEMLNDVKNDFAKDTIKIMKNNSISDFEDHYGYGYSGEYCYGY